MLRMPGQPQTLCMTLSEWPHLVFWAPDLGKRNGWIGGMVWISMSSGCQLLHTSWWIFVAVNEDQRTQMHEVDATDQPPWQLLSYTWQHSYGHARHPGTSRLHTLNNLYLIRKTHSLTQTSPRVSTGGASATVCCNKAGLLLPDDPVLPIATSFSKASWPFSSCSADARILPCKHTVLLFAFERMEWVS